MSSINVSEVASILLDSEMTVEQVSRAMEPFIDSIIAFDFEYSILCAALKKSTKHLGLSLGDRACISLGIKLGLVIYTADKIWVELKLENADIRLIK
jgi:PIN domain nuclease of toxin-antitoxin system